MQLILFACLVLLSFARVSLGYVTEMDPQIVGQCNTPGTAKAIAISGNFAYVADGSAGLQVINVTNPGAAIRIGSFATGGDASSLVVSDGFAYVAAGAAGVQILDVSEPSAPQRAAIIASTNAINVLLRDSRLYVAASGQLQVFDVANPSAPSLLGSYPTNFSQITFLGENLCGVIGQDYSLGVQLVDVSDPAALRFISNFTPGGQDYFNYVNGFVASGTSIFYSYVHSRLCCEGEVVTDSTQVVAVDLSDPVKPRMQSQLQFTALTMRVMQANGLLALNGTDTARLTRARLQFVDITDPNRMFLRAPLEMNSAKLVFSGDLAYILEGGPRFLIADLARKANPRSSARFRAGGSISSMAGQGDYIYAADSVDGLVSLDVSDIRQPKPLSASGKGASLVNVAGKTAFLGTAGDGIQIFDISDPAHPNFLASYPAAARSLGAAGDYLYYSTSTGNFALNVSAPAAPTLVTIGFPGLPTAPLLSVENDRVYFGGYPGFVSVFDALTPGKFITGFKTTNDITAVAISGTLLFALGWEDEVQAWDLSDTAHPRFISLVRTGVITDRPLGASVLGHYLYFSFYGARQSATEGLLVIDVKDPGNMRVAARNPDMTAVAFAKNTGRLYTALGNGGLAILEPFPQVRMSVNADTGLHLVVDGPSGIAGEIQRSGDLIDWQLWKPVTFMGGLLELDLDRQESGGFYRFFAP